MNDVAAVVVTYNRLDFLKQCLSHLNSQTVPCDILVVDNASQDGTSEWISDYAQNNDHVFCHRMETNSGGAGGFNFGMRRAAEAGYSYIWIMDDDCLPREDALEQLLNAYSIIHPSPCGFVSSAVLWTDGSECKMNRQKIRKAYYEHVELMRHGIIQVEQATFVSLLFPADTVRSVGLPISDFFIWGDDIEYTRRITVRSNIPCYMAGQSQVIHAMASNNGSSIALDAPERIGRYRYAFRNENYLYRKEGFRGFCYYSAKCGLNLCRILRYSRDHRLKRMGIIIGQYFKGLFFNPKVEHISQSEISAK